MKRNKEILRKELNDIKKRFLENLNQFRQTYGMLIEEEKNDKASELEYKFYKITKPALIKQKKDECKKARDKYLLNKQKVSSLHNDLANINKAYKTAISKFKLEYKTLLKIGNNDKTREFKHKFYTVIKPALIKQKKCDCKITKQKWLLKKHNNPCLHNDLVNIKKVYKTAVKKFKAAYKNLLNQNKHNEAKTLKSVFYKNERPKLIKQRKENITNAKMKWKPFLLAKVMLHSDIVAIKKQYHSEIEKFKNRHALLIRQQRFELAKNLKKKFKQIDKPQLIETKNSQILAAQRKWLRFENDNATKPKIKVVKVTFHSEIKKIKKQYRLEITNFKNEYKNLIRRKQYKEAGLFKINFNKNILPKLQSKRANDIKLIRIKYHKIHASKKLFHIFAAKKFILGSLIASSSSLVIFVLLLIIAASNVSGIEFNLTNYGSLTLFGIVTICALFALIIVMIVSSVLYVRHLRDEHKKQIKIN